MTGAQIEQKCGTRIHC